MKLALFRHLLLLVILACLLIGGISAYWWFESYRFQTNALWTQRREHNQIISNRGTIYFVQNHKWWRQEKFQIVNSPFTSSPPAKNWIGMQIDSGWSFWGFKRASGKWISPFIFVDETTKFTTPTIRIKPGTNYSSTTPIDIYGIPYWYIVINSVLWLVAASMHPAMRSWKLQIGKKPEQVQMIP